MDVGDALNRAVPRGAAPESMKDVVDYLGGTKAAAEYLGKSQRQVQRYLKADREGRSVKAPAAQQLRDAGTSEPVRKARMGDRRETRMRTQGAQVKAKGRMGVVSGGVEYMRDRRIGYDGGGIQLSPDQMDTILDAWLAGDDQAAHDALIDALDDQYQAGWEIEDLDFLSFT